MKTTRSKGYADGFDAVIRALIDFFERDVIYIKEVNSKNLQRFADYLQTSRTMTRINQYGEEYKFTRPPVKDQTALDYLGAIKTLLKAVCDEYNDEDGELSIITHNPFRKQIIAVKQEPEKRNLAVEDLIKIINFSDAAGRMGLARDVFLLSFYLIGMNTADLFEVETSALSAGRLTYERMKTRTRRKDAALISIKVEPEVEALLQKYRDPAKKRVLRFYRHYMTILTSCDFNATNIHDNQLIN